MAISIKTDWKPMDVPTAMEFNRIENNIAELEDSKEPNIDVLPIDKGGTGAKTAAAACKALGIEDYEWVIPCRVITPDDNKSNKDEGENDDVVHNVRFIGVRVGSTVICSGHVSLVIPFRGYLRIDAPLYVASVSANPTCPLNDNTDIQCYCTLEGLQACVACNKYYDGGFMINLTLSSKLDAGR